MADKFRVTISANNTDTVAYEGTNERHALAIAKQELRDASLAVGVGFACSEIRWYGPDREWHLTHYFNAHNGRLMFPNPEGGWRFEYEGWPNQGFVYPRTEQKIQAA
jgi:hypothetical protein